MKYHCFFEQSGTFKNEFKKLGFEAFDYFKKPTQFFCVNFKPYSNFIFESLYYVKVGRVEWIEHSDRINQKNQRRDRSLIHPQFANRFIRTYLVKEPAEGDSEK